jgi:hypothetical protein
VAVILAYAALIIGPAILMLVVLGARTQGLSDPAALDHAQLARHLAAGDGFATSLVRPLSLVFKADLAQHPDLYNAPAHPLALALFYRAFQPSDRVTAAAGAALWVLSVWLTFLVANRWFGARTAALATIFYACNVAAIAAAVGGLPQPMAAVAILLAAWLAVPNAVAQSTPSDTGPPPGGEHSPGLPTWRLVLAGVACALAALTDYMLAAVALVVGSWLVASERRRGRAMGLFLSGFAATLLPWLWRTFRLVGSPVFSLSAYGALANTGAYPGDSVWRLAEPPDPPLLFVVHHPLQTALKAIAGLSQFRQESLAIIDPVIGFLFLGALLYRTGSPRWNQLLIAAAGSMAVFILGSCLLQPRPGMLVAWAPLLCIAAAQGLSVWLLDRVEGMELGRRWIPEEWIRGLGYGAVLAVVGFPLVSFILVQRPRSDPPLQEIVEALKPRVSPAATVLTDQPHLVAWYAERRALWLPQREQDLETVERLLGPVDAAYVTPGMARLPAEEQGSWWFWLSAPAGVYRGLALADPMPAGAVLRLRRKEARE